MSRNYVKSTRKKVLMRPCLQSLRIPIQPCCLPHFVVNEPPCHHNYDYPEIYDISHCERPCCPFGYDLPENDINEINRRQQNDFVEENRMVELDDRVTRDGEENHEPNENIQHHVNDPPNAIPAQDQRNKYHLGRISRNNNNRDINANNRFNSRDDVRHVGTIAAPTTSCKGNQVEIDAKNQPSDKLNAEENRNNKSVDAHGLSLDRGRRHSKLTQANQPDPNYSMTEIEEPDNMINQSYVSMPSYREKFPKEKNEFASQPEFFSPLATSSMHERNTGYITPPDYVNGSIRHPFDSSNPYQQMSRQVQEDLVNHDHDCCTNEQLNPSRFSSPRISNTSPHVSTRNMLENRNPKYNLAEERSNRESNINQLNPNMVSCNSRYPRPSNPQMSYTSPQDPTRNMPDNRNPQHDRPERCCIESSNIKSNPDMVPSCSRYPRPSNPQMSYANPYESDPRSMLESRNPKYDRAERCCEDSSTFLNLIPSTSKYLEAENSVHKRQYKCQTGSPHGPSRKNIPENRNTNNGREEICCKDFNTNQSKPNRIPSKSRCSISKISLNGRQCYTGSPIVLTNEEDCCCKEVKDTEEYRSRFKKGRKDFRNINCNCPSDQVYGQMKSSEEVCDRIDATSCVSVSRVAEQGPGCHCRYPPFFKQFSCVGNINGSCTCIDNYNLH